MADIGASVQERVGVGVGSGWVESEAPLLVVAEVLDAATQVPSAPDPAHPPGRDERREFEHRRHGTVSIIAAMDVATGQVVAQRIERNNSAAIT